MEDWEAVAKNPTWRGLQSMATLADTYISGVPIDYVGRLFCSCPGLGKTEIIERAIKKYNAATKRCVPATVAGFVQALWLNRDHPMFIDDADQLPRDNDAMNIGKNAWGATRLVVSPSTATVQKNQDVRDDPDKYNPSIPDPEFNMGPRHRVIWNSNLDYEHYEKTLPVRCHAVFAGIASRLAPKWINSEPQNVMNYTIWMVIQGNMLRGFPIGGGEGGFSGQHVQDVLNFFCTKAPFIRDLSPRFVHMLAVARRRDPEWQEVFNERLSATIVHKGLILPNQPPQIIAYRRAKVAASPQPDPEPESDPPTPAAAPKPEAPKTEAKAIAAAMKPPMLLLTGPKQPPAPAAAPKPEPEPAPTKTEARAIAPLLLTYEPDPAPAAVVAVVPDPEPSPADPDPAPAAAATKPMTKINSLRAVRGINDVVYTSDECAKRIVDYFKPSGKMLDPCRGRMAFWQFMPGADWCEISEGRDFLEYKEKVDWIAGNPPWSNELYRAFVSHACEIADNVVFLIRLHNAVGTYARHRDFRQHGHAIKEFIVLGWKEAGIPAEGYALVVVHWQRGWEGGTKWTYWTDVPVNHEKLEGLAPLPDPEPEPDPPTAAPKPARKPRKTQAPAAIEPASERTEESLAQDIANVLYARKDPVLITPSGDHVLVQSHSETKDFFCEARLLPISGMKLEPFSINIAGRANGKYVLQYGSAEMAGEQAKIKQDIEWLDMPMPDHDMREEIVLAKANKKKRITICDDNWTFDISDLAWVMRKKAVLRYCTHGVINAVEKTKFGDYTLFLRGKQR